MNVLVTVTGPDRPGITTRITGVLAGCGAQMLDGLNDVLHPLRLRRSFRLRTAFFEWPRGSFYALMLAAESLGASRQLPRFVEPSGCLRVTAALLQFFDGLLRVLLGLLGRCSGRADERQGDDG
jgi:hypothetical protein